MLEDCFHRHGSREVIVDGSRRLTYAELGQHVACTAASLQSLGLGPGDRIAIWAPESWRWIVAALAAWYSGCVVLPISSRLGMLEVIPTLRRSGARLLFGSVRSSQCPLDAILRNWSGEGGQEQDKIPTLVDLDDAGPCQEAIHDWADFLSRGADAPTPPPARVSSADDLCEILLTSGTTGQPKGVMLSHAQVLRLYWNAGARYLTTEQDRYLAIPPIEHTMGINHGVLRNLMYGATYILGGNLPRNHVLQMITSEKITMISGAPSLFRELLAQCDKEDSDLAMLRCASITAAHIPPDLVRQLRREAGIDFVATAYALTECPNISGTLADDSEEVICTTVGRPVGGVSVRIVGEDGGEKAPGEIGEIQVNGYAVMLGYFDDETLTLQTVTPDGWLRTGDLGTFTDEGYLRIIGRIKDMYICHGLNVYPSDVEAQLMQSQLLAEVAVVGRKHRIAGEAGTAFLVPARPEEFDLKELRTWARDNMANYKVPIKFVVLPALPRNASGKLDKVALEKQLDS